MITTQYGEPVDAIVYLDEKTGIVEVEMTDRINRVKFRRDYMLHQLRADGGIKEIVAAAEKRRA